MSKAASSIRFQIRETPTSELIRGTFKSTMMNSDGDDENDMILIVYQDDFEWYDYAD